MSRLVVPRAGRSVGMPAAVRAGGGGASTPESLEAAIADLSPTAHIRMSESSVPTEQGSVSRTWSASGFVTYQDEAGPDGNSYATYGTNSGFTTPSTSDLNLSASSGRTFCIAFARNGSSLQASLFGKLEAGTPRDYAVFAQFGDRLIQANAYADGLSTVHSTYRTGSGYTEGSGVWNFAVFRFNTDGTWDIWLNSTTESSTEVTAVTGTVEEDGTASLAVGRLLPFNNYDWDGGALAHFAMFPTALSNSDVETLVQAAIDEGWTP